MQFHAFFYLIGFLSFPFTKTEKTDNPSSFDWTEKNYFVVEQLEPKILLSAAPIDAPIDSLDVVSEESNERFLTSDTTFSNEFFVEEKIENRDKVEIEEEYLFSQAESIDFDGLESGATNEIDVAVNAVVNEQGVLHIKENDVLKGAGIINGHIINEGLISPGYSPGLIQDRAMTLEEGGVLLIELGGTDINQFDRIVVDEEVNLGGKLEVELIDGYSPNVGDKFEFMNFGESLVLRFNNSGSAVKKEIKRGADYINISFDQSEGRIFSASLIEDPLDVDRDGWQDETEIIFGSTPSDPESVPAFKMIVQKFENGQFQVLFPGEKDVSYTIQISSNLKDWIVLGDPIIGNGNIMRECFKVSGNTSFLRITKN